ncbi:hypothetical protein BC332_29234 [Capsicum chinense]|nr:hypothetical protein BC332_29234 [Capsicum chinense]
MVESGSRGLLNSEEVKIGSFPEEDSLHRQVSSFGSSGFRIYTGKQKVVKTKPEGIGLDEETVTTFVKPVQPDVQMEDNISLSGPIPDLSVPVTPTLKKFDIRSFLLNPSLCGEVVDKLCLSAPFFDSPSSAASPPTLYQNAQSEGVSQHKHKKTKWDLDPVVEIAESSESGSRGLLNSEEARFNEMMQRLRQGNLGLSTEDMNKMIGNLEITKHYVMNEAMRVDGLQQVVQVPEVTNLTTSAVGVGMGSQLQPSPITSSPLTSSAVGASSSVGVGMGSQLQQSPLTSSAVGTAGCGNGVSIATTPHHFFPSHFFCCGGHHICCGGDGVSIARFFIRGIGDGVSIATKPSHFFCCGDHFCCWGDDVSNAHFICGGGNGV